MDDDLRRRIAEEAEAVAARLGKDNAELREANERMRKKMEDDREEMERRMENESKVSMAFIPSLLTFQTLLYISTQELQQRLTEEAERSDSSKKALEKRMAEERLNTAQKMEADAAERDRERQDLEAKLIM